MGGTRFSGAEPVMSDEYYYRAIWYRNLHTKLTNLANDRAEQKFGHHGTF